VRWRTVIFNFQIKDVKMHCWSYFLLCFVRIALTLLPQTGYIHPDEYFQSTEILAGEFAAFFCSNAMIFIINYYAQLCFRSSIQAGNLHTVGIQYNLTHQKHVSTTADYRRPLFINATG
jgi:hypothetical protein